MAGSDAVARSSRAGLAGRALRRLASDGGRGRDRLPLRHGVPRGGSRLRSRPQGSRRGRVGDGRGGIRARPRVQPSPRAPAALLRVSGRTADRRLHGPDGHVPHARPPRSAPALQPDCAAGRSRPEQASDRSVHREGSPGYAGPARAHRDSRAPRRDRPPADRRSDVRGLGLVPDRLAEPGAIQHGGRRRRRTRERAARADQRAGRRRGAGTVRARVGTRKKWYRLPEEVAHGSPAGGG